MMQHHRLSGDIRRKSTGEPLGQLLSLQAKDHWTCVRTSSINDRLMELCHAWPNVVDRPLVRAREVPFFTNITMINDFFDFLLDNQTNESFRRLCHYIAENGLDSSFGSDTEARLVDSHVRRSREISRNMNLVLGMQDEEVRGTAQLLMQHKWGLASASATDVVFYKMCLYESGDHFETPHRGSLHDAEHVATVLVTMQSPDLDGGRVLFHDTPEEDSAPDSIGEEHASFTKMYVFFADTEYSVEPVRRGHLVTFEYDVLMRREHVQEQQQASVDDSAELLEKINAQLERQHERGRVPALLLSHMYGVCQTSSRTLHGYDKLMYDALAKRWDVELMPVRLSERNNKCESLLESDDERTRQLSLFIPYKQHTSDTACLESKPREDDLQYTFMAMILNKK